VVVEWLGVLIAEPPAVEVPPGELVLEQSPVLAGQLVVVRAPGGLQEQAEHLAATPRSAVVLELRRLWEPVPRPALAAGPLVRRFADRRIRYNTRALVEVLQPVMLAILERQSVELQPAMLQIPAAALIHRVQLLQRAHLGRHWPRPKIPLSWHRCRRVSDKKRIWVLC
jgi:hypothetical protein